MLTLRLRVAVGGVAVPLEVQHHETIESITRRVLHSLFGPEASPAVEQCQMQLGDQTLDMATQVHEIDIQTGLHLNLVLPF